MNLSVVDECFAFDPTENLVQKMGFAKIPLIISDMGISFSDFISGVYAL